MIRKSLFGLAILVSLFFAASARADLMSGERIRGDSLYKLSATFRDNGYTSTVNTSPFHVTNTQTGDEFIAFCGDFRVQPGYNFIGEKGHPYSTSTLETASIYSDLQKQQLTDLYGYTYGSAFDNSGTLLDQTLASAIQVATWEILTEGGSNLAINAGTFLTTSLDAEVRAVVNDLLGALNGTLLWDDLDYMWNEYDKSSASSQR